MNKDYQISYEVVSKSCEKTYTNLTCLLVVKGQLSLQTNTKQLTLKSGDFFFINMNEQVRIEPVDKESTKVFKLSISNIYLLRHYEDFLTSQFNCHSLLTDPDDLNFVAQMKHHLVQLILNFFSGEKSKYLKSTIHLQELLLILIERFKVSIFNAKTFQYNEKLNAVFEYIHSHYREPITLGDVARECFMSTSSLSRLFQEHTGIKFNRYVNQLRIQMSLNDLLYTQDSVDQIASNYGFSNSKTYRTQFSRFFEESPTEYKRNFYKKETTIVEKKAAIELEELVSNDDLELLQKFMEVKTEEVSVTESKTQKATLQIESVQNRPLVHSDVIIHINSLEDLFLEEVKKQIITIKEEIGCHYIGIQNLFKVAPSSYTVFEQTKLSLFSPFSRFDTVVDFIRSNHFGVYYQLNLKDYDQITSFYNKDHQEFFKYIEYMTRNEFLPNWRISIQFERWEVAKSVKAFKELRGKIKKINDCIQVGVGLPTGYPNYSFNDAEEEMLFREEILNIAEFVSYKSEPNYTVKDPDLSKYELFASKDVQKMKNTLTSWGVDLPFILTEWNTLTGSTRYTNSYFFRAALIVHDLQKLDLLVDSYGFWLNTYLFEGNHCNIDSVKYDGLEVFHYYNCRRPVFFALSLYKRLKGQVVATGDHFILTTVNGHYQLLTWNAQYISPNLATNECYLKSKVLELEIHSSTVPNGLYQIKKFTLSKEHGAVAYSYNRFSSQQILDEESHQYLSRISHPKMNVFDKQFTNGLHMSCYLEANNICLYEFLKIDD